MTFIQTEQQLGFDDLLADCEAANRQLAFDRDTAHLPTTMKDGVRCYRHLIDQHHRAMLCADIESVRAIRDDARNLALRLNGGKPGIIAGDDAPGCVLERETAAEQGAIPLWGQCGTFTIDIDGVSTQIELDGMFGIGAAFQHWPGFAIRAVDKARPFFSETGYRSFLGIQADIVEDLMPDQFVTLVVRRFRQSELKGKLVPVSQRWH